MRETEEELARAEAAKVTFAHIDQCVMLIKAGMVSNFQDTKSGIFGRKERDEIHRQMNSLDAITNILKREIDGGKLAMNLIKKDQKLNRVS